jgi:hypothetical protein
VSAEEGDASSSALGKGDKDPSDVADDAEEEGSTSAEEEEALREGGTEDVEEIETVVEEIVEGEGEMLPADGAEGGEDGEEGDFPSGPAEGGEDALPEDGEENEEDGLRFCSCRSVANEATKGPGVEPG